MDERFMREALREAAAARDEDEIPVGAVIVWKGRIIAKGHNMVERLHDPTAHAEVSTIREACRKLGTYSLEGCEIYTSCEPCPMCLGAIYWAHLDKIYYANDRKDAANIGFDDDFIYKEIAIPPYRRQKPSEILLRDEAIKAFELWSQKKDKKEY